MTPLPPAPPALSPSSPISIVVAEHQRRSIRRFRPPVKVIWITVRPSQRLRFEFARSRQQTVVATVVTVHF